MPAEIGIIDLKLISGGQTGVDRAALDVALILGIPCGGWCPKGRKADDGVIDKKYPLVETQSENYTQRTETNVRESDGTLILTWGNPLGGTALALDYAKNNAKPYLVIDMEKERFIAQVLLWYKENKIKIMNIAGPRASFRENVYQEAYDFLFRIFRK